MSKIYSLYALDNLMDFEAEEMPLDIWLPYVQLESERFICQDTGEVWHRFEGVTVYMEDEDYPEGDLLEEGVKVPEGLVCWQSKKGTLPELGDVFRVLDRDNQVVFEEVISSKTELYGKKYASAQKEGAMTRDLLLDIEQALRCGLGDSFGNNLLNYAELEAGSHMDEIKNEEKVLFSVHGISFVMIVYERETHSPCKLTFYEVDGKSLHSYEQRMAAGDKWFDVCYKAANDSGPAMCVGWGIGNAQEAAKKAQRVIGTFIECRSLGDVLLDARRRANHSNHFENEPELNLE